MMTQNDNIRSQERQKNVLMKVKTKQLVFMESIKVLKYIIRCTIMSIYKNILFTFMDGVFLDFEKIC